MIANILVGLLTAGSLAWWSRRVVAVHRRHRKPLVPPAPYFHLRSGSYLEDGRPVTYVAGRRVEP